MAQADPSSGREVIFEFIALGDSVRVAAVDVRTGEEVYITGPAKTPQADLERIALRKLFKKLELADDPDKKTPRRGGRGVIV